MESKAITQEERNKQIIREFTRVFKNEHNVDGVAHLFDTQGFVHHFRSPLPAGFDGLRQVGVMMNGAFPDVVVSEEDLIASGDKVVERSTAVATHKGSMMGEPPTNKRVVWSEIQFIACKTGRFESTGRRYPCWNFCNRSACFRKPLNSCTRCGTCCWRASAFGGS